MTRVRRLTQILGITLIALMAVAYSVEREAYRVDDTTEILIVANPINPLNPVVKNPYQEEYERMLYPTVRITAGWSTGTGVVIATTDSNCSTRCRRREHS